MILVIHVDSVSPLHPVPWVLPYAWVEYIMANIGLVIILASYFQDFC